MKRLNGNVTLITGGGKGIGYGLAEAFAEQGSNLVITGRTESRLIAAQQKLEQQYGVEVLPIVADGADEEAIKMVEDRKAWYKETGQKYYRPWIVVMTDGEPYGNRASQADIDAISARVASDAAAKKYTMIGIGVGEANMELLSKMCGGKALPLKGTKFTEFFKWLSNSLSMVSTSKEGEKVNISQGADAWMDSFEI